MGFSVTAAHVIFALAMLTAGSVAASAYWKTQDHIEEARRAQDRRVVDAIHTNVTFVGDPAYDPAAGGTVTFLVKNTGSVGLDRTLFQYLLDGAIKGTMAAGWPKLNGAASASTLLLPGDTLEVRLEGAGANPARMQVVTEYGVNGHYP
ncbi:MAG TPA: hypothetical protein VNX21_01360 [Candidatus Thermoplasmatota archaeon]|nr:hypothetical protein [Candidatus Thermoplasmatota archaeon]